ncbi:MAG: DUF1015 domain-containing protein [Acidobacteria bacterium]|nr:DUF1015 domain-containing protein [Acidobacteriota bacterium]
MATLHPFRGWRYGSSHKGRLEQLISPPYDVISESRRREMAAADPHGFVHLILPEEGREGDRYRHAAGLLRAWQNEGVLVEDERPAFTLHRQTYDHPEGGRRTRSGLIGLLPLPAAHDTTVRPHEHTMHGPRDDRRRLMVATSCQLSPVFLLAADEDGAIARLLDRSWSESLSFNDTDGIRHEVELIDDAQMNQELQSAFAGTTLVIADGHHRYESARACRDQLAARQGADDAMVARAGLVLAEVVSMASPGLSVLAFHRTVRDLAGFDLQGWRDRLASRHRLEPMSGVEIPDLMEHLATAPRGSFGLALATEPHLYILTMAEGEASDSPVDHLDVARLHGTILAAELGLDEEAVAAGKVGFHRDAVAALAEVRAGRSQVAFLLRPTPMEDLLKVTAAGLRMPQKSTNFYPKVPAGLVLHSFAA